MSNQDDPDNEGANGSWVGGSGSDGGVGPGNMKQLGQWLVVILEADEDEEMYLRYLRYLRYL